MARQFNLSDIPIRQKAPADRLIHHPDLLQRLGILFPQFPIILVGGTNGKGSTTHLIGRIFMEAGYKVGINTSPHLVKFNERVRINETPISDEALIGYLNQINQDFSDFPLGYNEYSFLLGLYAFIHQEVDLAVFEIGLGGRWDPANLLSADLSVITNIDLDHTEILGDTIEKIAAEKAGIIKANKPLICGQIPCPLAIQAQAKNQSAPIYLMGKDFSFEKFQKIYELPPPDQLSLLPCNAALGLQAALLAQEFLPIPKENREKKSEKNLGQILKTALEEIHVPGRLQIIPWKHNLLLDVCHNPGGCEALKNYLLAHPISGKNYALFAVSETKDCQKMFQIMAPVIDNWIFPAIQDLKKPEVLLQEITPYITEPMINSQPLREILDFLETELISTDPAILHRLIVFGSFYLGGELLCALSGT